jgi:heptose I phosphotransferase
MMVLRPDIQSDLPSHHFKDMMHLKGEVYRALEGRCTMRLVLNGHAYFIKQHTGVGWKEICKNIVQLRWPIISAKNEYLAIEQLNTLGIKTLDAVGFGSKGLNPARKQSFLLTLELPPSISLEDLCKDWQTKRPLFATKCALIKEVARIARLMHESGMNHRDFYLCHFLLDRNSPHTLYLIDLHRAGIRKKTPLRWIIKDLAGLWFSSKEIGLTHSDRLRFIREYRNSTLRECIKEESTFWNKVKHRGDKLYREQKQHNDKRLTMENTATR